MSRFDVAPWLGGAFILGAWEAAARLTDAPEYLLPAPTAILRALIQGWSTLIPAAGITLGLALTALAVATVIGLALAITFRHVTVLERAFGPFALILQATPVVAIAPLVVIWTGVENPRRAIVVLAVIVAFFPVFANALAGLKSVDPGLDRLFSLYRASPWQRVLRLEIPSMAPTLLAGLRTAAGLSLVGAVVGEFVAGTGATGGLAWRILEAGNRLQTPTMFAALLLLAAMGVALNALVDWAERRVRA